MTGKEVTAWTEKNGETDARNLLKRHFPTVQKRLNSISRKLDEIRKEVAKEYPEANWYLSNETLCLMLGQTHGEKDKFESKDKAHPERIGAETQIPYSGGGDW